MPIDHAAPARQVPMRLTLRVLMAGALALVVGAAPALADSGRDAHSTFTKYVTVAPEMAGIVGGDVGTGTFSGTILSITPGTTTFIEAIYRFNGAHHAFVARMHVQQTGLTAVITGNVTDGWLAGNQVRGAFTEITCSLSGSPTLCWTGSVDILRGTKH
jgi:hypothetical protein